MLSFECIKNEKSVYFLLTSALCQRFKVFGWAEKISSDLSAQARGTELSCQHFGREDR